MEPAGRSPDTRLSSCPAQGPPYLQAVGAWLRRRLVRLQEDLLAPPEELDNSNEDVVQHQDHARSRLPARRPGSRSRSARPRQLRRVRASVRPAPPRPAPHPPPPPRLPPRNRGRHPSAPRISGPHRSPQQLSPPSSLRFQGSCSWSAIRIPRQAAGSQPSLPSSCPFATPVTTSRGSLLRDPLPTDHLRIPITAPGTEKVLKPGQRPKAETRAAEEVGGVRRDGAGGT